MIRINASEKDEVLTALREEGLKNLLLEMWLEDFPLDKYAQLYRIGEKGYVLNVPTIATIFSYPDEYTLPDDEKLKIMAYASPIIMGPEKIVHLVRSLFPDREIKDSVMMGMVLHEYREIPANAIELTTDKHFRDLYELYMSVPEFKATFSDYSKEGFREEYMEARLSGWITTGVYEDDKLVSAATFRFYEIENVCTAPGYRNRGYAKEALQKLLSLIPDTKDGKRLILFTGNPQAEHLYSTLGFQNLGGFSKTN